MSSLNSLKLFNNSSKAVFSVKISLFLSITSLSSFNLGKIFFILFIKIEGLSDFPSKSADEYDKNIFSSDVLKALYILKLSSYSFSNVPFASSVPFSFNISLSLSLKYPSFLFTLGNIPSFNPIINTVLTLWLLDLSTSPTITWSCVPGIFPSPLFPSPVFNISTYFSKLTFLSPKTCTISSNTSIIIL